LAVSTTPKLQEACHFFINLPLLGQTLLPVSVPKLVGEIQKLATGNICPG
jgi:hypothetical protein